jgi:hypothetical protein
MGKPPESVGGRGLVEPWHLSARLPVYPTILGIPAEDVPWEDAMKDPAHLSPLPPDPFAVGTGSPLPARSTVITTCSPLPARSTVITNCSPLPARSTVLSHSSPLPPDLR